MISLYARFTALVAVTALAVPSMSGLVTAQEVLQRNRHVISALNDWNYQPLYREGWSANRLFNDATIYSTGGDELGTLKNLLLDRNGKIVGIIAEVGGFFDIGDTHVFVPWNAVKISSLRRVYIPVTEDNVDEYRAAPSLITRTLTDTIRNVGENLRTGPGVWKATDLINDYVYLGDDVEFGYVRDLIFNGDGQLFAYVVSADAKWGGGPYALPFTRKATWDPGSDRFDAPYGEQEVRELDQLDYTRMNENVEIRGRN